MAFGILRVRLGRHDRPSNWGILKIFGWLGFPHVLDKKQVAVAESLYDDGKTSVAEICRKLGISRATFYRNIATKAA